MGFGWLLTGTLYKAGLTTVTAIAAVVALIQASQTVRETRAMRREERIARIRGLIDDLVHRLLSAYTSGYDPKNQRWLEAHSARERLRGAIASTGEDLPACRALMTSPIFPRERGRTENRARLRDAARSDYGCDRRVH